MTIVMHDGHIIWSRPGRPDAIVGGPEIEIKVRRYGPIQTLYISEEDRILDEMKAANTRSALAMLCSSDCIVNVSGTLIEGSLDDDVASNLGTITIVTTGQSAWRGLVKHVIEAGSKAEAGLNIQSALRTRVHMDLIAEPA